MARLEVTALPGFSDQHQRGCMVPAILTELRIVAARILCRSDGLFAPCPVGAPAAAVPVVAGASLFDVFHGSDNA